MKSPYLLVLATVLACDRACAFMLRVTSCNIDNGGTPDEEITFEFCEGGSYCTEDGTEDDVVGVPPSVDINVAGATVAIPVSPGYEPTTAKFVKGFGDSSHDAWCITEVTWENGDNLLGQDAILYLERETGDMGCNNGIADELPQVSACRNEWVFFNINGDRDYEYDVRVKACAGTSSSSIRAYFCSNSHCDGTTGEEEEVILQMSDVEGGWTDVSFPLPFNPLAMRLEEMDGVAEWCADDLIFNAFPVILGSSNTTELETTGLQIFPNIQANGQGNPPTPSPTPSPVGETTTPIDQTTSADEESDDRWFSAAWEVAVTVIGAAVVAAGAGCKALFCRRSRSLSGPSHPPDAHLGQAEVRSADTSG